MKISRSVDTGTALLIYRTILLLFGAAQLRDPFVQFGQLGIPDTPERDAHSQIGQDKYHFAECRECGAVMRDSDPNLRTFLKRIQCVEEATAKTQVAGFTA